MSLTKKQKRLAAMAKILKKKYVGIDNQIDEILKQISVWYLYPEFQLRPTVINLFGLTGVGKTSLIRDIVKLLNFSDRYCEIELDNAQNMYATVNRGFNSTNTHNKSILDSLFEIKLKPCDAGILLLDEVHRFRTVNNGVYKPSVRYEDVWKLLSDGYLFDKNYIIYTLKKEMLNIKQAMHTSLTNFFTNEGSKDLSVNDKLKVAFGMKSNNTSINPNDSIVNPIEFHNSRPRNYASTYHILNLVEITEDDLIFIQNQKLIYQPDTEYMNILAERIKGEERSVKSILDTCSNQVMVNFLERKIKELESIDKIKFSLEETDDKYIYSKLLIFICGNLDNDSIYENPNRSTKEVVEELKKMFRPEQVSRLGKNFILYPIFNKEHFEEMINREFIIHNKRLKEKFEIELSDKDLKYIKDQIFNDETLDYTQGIRPLISSIGRILGEIVPMKLIHKQQKEIGDE